MGYDLERRVRFRDIEGHDPARWAEFRRRYRELERRAAGLVDPARLPPGWDPVSAIACQA